MSSQEDDCTATLNGNSVKVEKRMGVRSEDRSLIGSNAAEARGCAAPTLGAPDAMHGGYLITNQTSFLDLHNFCVFDYQSRNAIFKSNTHALLAPSMTKITDKLASLPNETHWFSLEFFPPKTTAVSLLIFCSIHQLLKTLHQMHTRKYSPTITRERVFKTSFPVSPVWPTLGPSSSP